MSITNLGLTSTATQSAAPFTFGHVFKQGDVPAGTSVVADFANFQCIPKNTWPDGSLKMAVLSGRATLTANVKRDVLLAIGTPTGGTALTTTDLKATGAVASLALANLKDWTFDTAAQTVGARLPMSSAADVLDGTSAITVNNSASLASPVVTQDAAAPTVVLTASVSGGTVNGYQTVTYTLKYKARRTITAITKAANARVSTPSSWIDSGEYALSIGNTLTFASIVGMTELNGLTGTVTAVDPSRLWFEVDINSTGFGTYASGGTATKTALHTQTTSTTAYVRAGGGLTWNGTANTYSASNSVAQSGASWAATDWDAPFQSWISGPQMSCWSYRKAIGSDPHLVAWLIVRLYAGGAVEILPWIENGYLNVAAPTSKVADYTFTLGGTVRYTGTIDLPNHARTPLVSGSTFRHWLGADPAVTPTHGKVYLQATGLVPTYSVAASGTILNAQAQTFSPLQQSNYHASMGSGGYHPSIGLLPAWDVAYATSGDERGYRGVIANAYSAGRFGTHFRDETTNRPLRFSGYPNLVMGGGNGVSATGASTTNSFTPAAAGLIPAAYASSHHPSMGYMAYLVTGCLYFLEELQFTATANFLKNQNNYRGFTGGVFDTERGANTTRGAAWAIRTLAQAASATPDADPTLHSEFTASMEANVDFYYNKYVAPIPKPNEFGIVVPYTTYTSGQSYTASAWQQDFFTAAVGYALSLGLNLTSTGKTRLTNLFAWKAKSIIFRFGQAGVPSDWSYRDAGAYYIPISPAVSGQNWDSPAAWFSTAQQMYETRSHETTPADQPRVNSDPDGPLRGANFPEATSYWGNLTPALAYAVEHGVSGADAAYAKFTGASNYNLLTESYASAPEWAISPNETSGVSMAGIGATTRVDSGNWITGKTVVGQRGLGILAQNIPSTGTNGAPPIYNDLSFPADNDKEVRWEIVTPPASGTFFAYEDGSFTYLGPTNTLTYKLWVAGQDMGNATVSLSVGTVDSTAPVMTGSIAVSAITTTGFTLTWSAATDATGVTGYEVSTDNGTSYTNVGNVLTIVKAGLTAATLYNVKVRAYDAAGNKATPLSTTATTSAVDSTAPVMVGTLTVSATNSNGFTTSWSAATDSVGVVGYEVSLNSGSTYTDIGNVLTYTSTGLTPSTTYNVRVRAYDAAANKATPLSVQGTTTADITVPVMVGALTASSINSGGFTISWQAATDNVAITGYKLSMDNGATYPYDLGNVLTTTRTGLFTSALYNVKVRAYDAAGNQSTPLSLAVSTTAFVDGIAPTMNGALTISVVNDDGFRAAWLAASDDIGVVGYEMSVDFGTPSYSPVGNVRSVSITGLEATTTYYVRVRAFDAGGNRSTALTTVVVTTVVVPSTLLPETRQIMTSTTLVKRILSSANTSIVFVRGAKQELALYNTSDNAVVVNIKGSAASEVHVPNAADSMVSVADGLNITVPAGLFTFVMLDSCYAYLNGNVTLTADADNAVMACLTS
jgi:hypothetical protein